MFSQSAIDPSGQDQDYKDGMVSMGKKRFSEFRDWFTELLSNASLYLGYGVDGGGVIPWPSFSFLVGSLAAEGRSRRGSAPKTCYFV